MPNANPLRIELRAGEVLFREGDPSTTGYLLEAGEIEVAIRIDGLPVVLSRLRAGDILGEMGVFDGAPRSASATALTDCVLLPIDRNQISERLDKADPIIRALLEGQVRRYRGAISAIRGTQRRDATEPDTPVETSAGDKFRLEAHLREALAGDGLDVRYQPIQYVASGRIAGYEALVRWNHPDRGPISPLEFVGLAEESQLIVPLGEYVFDTACRAVQRLLAAGFDPPPFIAVNVSARQLEHPGLIERVVDRVEAASVPRGSLKVEITESQALDHDLASAAIELCHRHGIKVALDDFGTGYSNMTQMHRLHFDTLKIDQAFSRTMLGDARAMAIVEAIVHMARALGADTVVEGIETEEMLEALRRLGCDFAQGYLIGRPQLLEELLAAAKLSARGRAGSRGGGLVYPRPTLFRIAAMADAVARKGLPLHVKMLVGFAVGLIGGLLVHVLAPGAGWVEWLTTWVTQPIGTIFLNLLFMLVIPLLFSALVTGVAELGDVRSLGRVGWRMLAYTVIVSSIAVIIGLVLVNLFRPGDGVDPALAQRLLAEGSARAQEIVAGNASSASGLGLLVQIVPKNVVTAAAGGDLLAVMFFSLMVGIGLLMTPTPAAEKFKGAVQGLFDVSMTLIHLVIRAAPYAVACLVFNLAALFGWDLVGKLAGYVGVVVLALALHMFVVYSLVLKFAGGWSPMAFFRSSQEAILMAFSTASSNATLPTALKVAEENLKLPPRIARFVLTVGATANQNGTALFEGVTVLFLAQFFGVHLDLGQQLLVMVVCILGGIGTAGVPAGSLPVVAMILAMVHVPPEGIGLILGVDRFLDMCRTSLNVTGDLVGAVVVSRGEPGASAAPATAEITQD